MIRPRRNSPFGYYPCRHATAEILPFSLWDWSSCYGKNHFYYYFAYSPMGLAVEIVDCDFADLIDNLSGFDLLYPGRSFSTPGIQFSSALGGYNLFETSFFVGSTPFWEKIGP